MANNSQDKGRLHGEHILLIAPRFFGYENVIKRNIEEQGAIVDWLPDRPFDRPIMAGITKLEPRLIMPFAGKIYANELNRFARAKYDKIVVINGQTLSQQFLTELRSQYSTATFILYMWDSLRNRGRIAKNFRLFDRILSFDHDAATSFNLEFRPLFFSPTQSDCREIKYYYDVSFIGTCHSDRYGILHQINAQIPPSYTRYWYRYLQSRFVYRVYKMMDANMRNAKMAEFNFKPLEKRKVDEIFRGSGCIVDIEHPLQSGLTMRTLEIMGAQKKMITTNDQVVNYDFYNEHNICVVDRSAPQIPDDFFDRVYQSQNNEIIQGYTLKSWVEDVVNTEPLTTVFRRDSI